jgi:glycosyltransferase involved in cell wall biosynthesis
MSEAPRVLLVARKLAYGGSERQLALLARELARCGFEPRAGCFQAAGVRAAELRASGVPVAEFPLRSFIRPEAAVQAWQMIRYLERERIAIVHAFDTPANLFAVPVARAARTPVVLSSQRAHRSLSGRPHRHLLRLTDQIADAVVVNCEYVKRHLIEDERIPVSRIRVCYNGLDLHRFSPQNRSKPDEFGGASLVIGTVCALRPEKRIETLIDAFARLETRPGLRLAIVGDGPTRPALEARARALGLGESCRFLGGRAEVADLLRGMDIFVLPSLSEALSNSLMEAMACGCCAVASRVGGNPELIWEGRTGILFGPGEAGELAEALRLLVENEALRRRMAEAGAEFVRTHFSSDAAARRMAEIYREFLGS